MYKAELYSKLNGEQSQSAKKYFSYFGDLLKEKYEYNAVTLIDIGSGCGHVLVNIIMKESQLNFSQVVGIDKNTDMIDFANERYGNDEIKFQLMDIQGSIPKALQSTQFDLVTSFYCLHWVRDFKKAFNTIHDFLKPDGLFLCVFAQTHIMPQICDKIIEKYSSYLGNYRNNLNDICFIDKSDEIIKQILNECGIQIVEFIDEKNDMYDFINEENLSGNFKGVS